MYLVLSRCEVSLISPKPGLDPKSVEGIVTGTFRSRGCRSSLPRAYGPFVSFQRRHSVKIKKIKKKGPDRGESHLRSSPDDKGRFIYL